MIGLIFIGDLIYCPYLKKYEEILKKSRVEYEVIYWNRSNIPYEDGETNRIAFERRSALLKSKRKKIRDFLAYRRWLKKLLKKKKYDRLILLSSISGMLLIDLILHFYKNNYIYDIRDYDSDKLYCYLEKKMIRNAWLTSISSKGFLKVLPKNNDYAYTHNMLIADWKAGRIFQKKKEGKLNFVWTGTVRYLVHQSKIIEKLDKDGRFQIIYHGYGPQLEQFKKFVEEKRLTNVVFTGGYDNAEKEKLLRNADILNNSYELSDVAKYAVSNKFYDGIIYHIPQLVECGCYKEELLKIYPVGIALDVESEDFADQLYRYYQQIDETKFDEVCEAAFCVFKQEEENCNKLIEQFVNF